MVDSFPPVTIDINKKKITVIPQYAPEDNDGWKHMNGITNFKRPYWWYVCRKTGRRTFLKYRINDLNDPTKKSFQYISFASGKWRKKNVFDALANQHGIKKDLYRGNYLEEYNPDIVDIVEGKKTCDSASKKFADLHFTTFGGASGYKNFDWTTLKGKKVLLHPDIEDSDFSTKEFEKLCLNLINDFEIDARVVRYPSYVEIVQMLRGAFDKKSWGLEDRIPEELDIYTLREKAYVPEPEPVVEEVEYSDIRKALKLFAYVRGSGNRYYEFLTRDLVEQSELNNMLLRAKAEGDFTERTASEWLQKNNIKIVNGLSYYPVDQQYIKRDNKLLINMYIDPKHANLGDIPDIKEKLDWFFKLLSFNCSYEEYETELLIKALACAVQYPDENRTWCILISSQEHGTGKGLIFKIIQYLLGQQNCFPLDLPTLNSNFNGYFLEANNLFVTEANNKGKEDSHTKGTLKNLLTEDLFSVERKNQERIRHYCHYNLYLSTNEVKPYSVEPNDRRHFYIRHELKPLPDEFYEDIKFNKVDRRDKDTKELELVAHYLKHVYKITREECQKFYGTRPKTRWHYLLLEESLTGYQQELNIILERKLIPSFHYDLWNRDQVYHELRTFLYSALSNKTHILSTLVSKDQIQKWFRTISAPAFRNDAIEPTTVQGHKGRGRYVIGRNRDKWLDPEINKDISKVNEHFNDPLTYARAYKGPEEYRDIEYDKRANPKHVGDILERERQQETGEIPF